MSRSALVSVAAGAALTLSACHGAGPATGSHAEAMATIVLVTAQATVPPSPTPSTLGEEPDGGALSAPVSPFDTSSLAVIRLDPPLLRAVQDAATSAAADGVTLLITSGWRSRAFQQQLLDDAVQTYGSLAVARQWVATPDESHHVQGKAVDIGPAAAYGWMLAHSTQFGLCQVFANEKWHYELTADAEGQCPPLRVNAAG
ncbi:M15 family metallopeptidase [Mycobacteroides franklinii]|uniref:Peptidase n=1 Tax=Mycobacteroides franklinii TaxID=948102 RepID=A0A4R8RED3_9MYCO|nr:M15 family metallopeptidase [Mycobacteroides franklinii]ORA58873.1 peptidase [Mycobacteroides franklinii]TDH21134.1 peptidase [Mycobacteroides franklinii]TDZ42571.1 D-alanyl-D-alanine carboxypeptidase [Mycobacteroides franklinii]TDZ52719.1 D-alanyl-D-alanine carboxypeptidase [Mycobacteroides franklinii]TDZ56126.1 D-alanyl-D-alanine carboxypeptidase [Mycobacteroides franklinii]